MTLLAAYDVTLAPAAGLALGLAVGGVLGLVHFASLDWTVRCLTDGLALRAAALQIARFALVAVTFLGLAQLGAAALIAGLLGLMLARRVVLRRRGGVP